MEKKSAESFVEEAEKVFAGGGICESLNDAYKETWNELQNTPEKSPRYKQLLAQLTALYKHLTSAGCPIWRPQ